MPLRIVDLSDALVGVDPLGGGRVIGDDDDDGLGLDDDVAPLHVSPFGLREDEHRPLPDLEEHGGYCPGSPETLVDGLTVFVGVDVTPCSLPCVAVVEPEFVWLMSDDRSFP